MELKSEKIQKLKDYFEKEPSALMAFLFGSRVGNLERKVSDWDIAVYLKKESLRKETKIWSDLVDILGKEVDLISLRDAPPILASRIVREGIPLKIKDRNFFLDFLLDITEKADYFIRFSKEYYEIYQRAKSLSETDKARIQKIFIFLERSLLEFEDFKKITFDEYNKNLIKRRNIERWIENLMNSVLDISKIILAAEKKPLPDTYKKILLEASLLLALNKKEREKLSEWAVLRNIIAHEYLEILWERINYFVRNAKSYLGKFLRKTKEFVNH